MQTVASIPRFERCPTGCGAYTKSAAPQRQLQDYLRDCARTRFKTAALGGDPEQGFEQAFSSLAYSYIKDKAPRLLDFIVGFQLVERNEDNTKAMGLFGFKVGNQWLYGPVFFLSGDLKGHELLYVKKHDMFVPMKENWVNYLISRKPHVLGEGSQRNTFELGGLLPNLVRLARIPLGSKYGSDGAAQLPIHIDDWAKPALPMMFALKARLATGLYPGLLKEADALRPLNFGQVVERPWQAALAPCARDLDLRQTLDNFPLLKLAFDKCYQAYPLIKQGFDRFYGRDFFRTMAEEIKVRQGSILKEAGSYIAPPGKLKKIRYKRPGPYLIEEEEEKKVDKNAGLTIVALDVSEDVEGQIEQNKPELTDAERERLLKDTVLIKDERDPHAVSMPYNTQMRLELSNPDASGLYEVLEKPGTFDEMLVLMHPHTGRGRETFALVIRKSDPRAWKNMAATNLWAKQNRQPTDTDFKEWVNDLDGTDSLQKGGTYVAFNDRGAGTCPFRVREVYGDGAYRVEWMDHLGYGESERKSLWTARSHDWDLAYSSYDAKLLINRRKGSSLRSVNGELSVPEDFKILKLKDPPKPRKDEDSIMPCDPTMHGESEETPIQPGNLVDVQLLIQKEARTLQLHDTGGETIWLRSPNGHERMTKKAALISLVRDHGLRERHARLMIKEAARQAVRNQPAVFLVKYAYGYGSTDLQANKPGAPAIPEPLRGTEQMGYNSVPSIYPQEEFVPVDSMSSQYNDPNIYNPFYLPDQNAMQSAQQAAQSGQKEVFDASMISGLLKSMDKDAPVEKYLPVLMKCTDALGRLLFLFFWNQSSYEERYGRDSLPELEDALRNTFEAVGSTALFLLEKNVAGDLNLDRMSSKREPNVDDAADK